VKNHLYYIRYRGHNGRDMVMIRTSTMSIPELTEQWHKWYEFAIKNHGYKLYDIIEEDFKYD
jgi:hypothetical protein